MSKIQESKIEFINFLENRGEYFRKVHEGQYNIRCPFCGDTQKNRSEGHLYIKANLDTDEAVAYNCFKCNESGPRITEKLLDALGCDNDLKERLLKNLKGSKTVFSGESRQVDFNFKLPDINIMPEKLKYIKDRLEIDFSETDFKQMKVITSLYDFLCTNKIKYRPFDNYAMNLLQNSFVGFLTNGSSHILFRDITDSNKYSWIKYPIEKDSIHNRVFYTIEQKNLDILTQEDIIINMSEGVFDCIGVANHFNYLKDNTMNIAVSGKKYASMLSYLISLGLVGGNVIVNIFSDNDEDFNKDKRNPKKVYDTSFEYLEVLLKKYRPLFKKINLYHNIKEKDYGIPKNKISLKKKSI